MIVAFGDVETILIYGFPGVLGVWMALCDLALVDDLEREQFPTESATDHDGDLSFVIVP